MNKKFLTFLIFFLLVVLVKPVPADALNIYIDKPTSVNVGDSVVLKIFIDTEGKEINTLEGILKVSGTTNISSINTGGSIFNLWTEKPSISNTQEIYFTGGTEGGIYGKNLRLFNFTITPTVEGIISIKPKELFAYLNDGIGTKIIGSNTGFEIKVEKKLDNIAIEKTALYSEDLDKNSPSSFIIELGHDEFLFGGKYFITFNATDSGSGINKYEVKEGNLPYVESQNTYVLKDQNLKSKIYVKAIDNAGNEKIEKLELGDSSLLFKVLLVILFIVVIWIVIIPLYKILKRKK